MSNTQLSDIVALWPVLNLDRIMEIQSMPEPLITFATISLYRYSFLLGSLEHNPSMTELNLNTCLRIQAAEEMPIQTKQLVLQILEDRYNNYDLQFTYKNHGNGLTRKDVVNRANTHFGTKFIMTIDDDILLPQYAPEIMISIFDLYPSLGALGLKIRPPNRIGKIDAMGTTLNHYEPERPIDFGDTIGYATMMIRREVLKTCTIDSEYYIGWCDTDFCMQMRKAGWEIAVLNLPNYVATNMKDNSRYYMKARDNIVEKEKSKIRFQKKWGIAINY